MFKNLLKSGGRLHKKIFLMMLVIGVVPILLAGVFSLYNVTDSNRVSTATIEENLINQKNSEIKAFVDNLTSGLNFQISVNDLETDFDIKNQEILLEGLLKDYPATAEVAFIDLDFGEETSRLNRASDKLELRDQSNLDKFKIAKGGGVYIGPVYFIGNQAMMTIAEPVKNALGNIISVVSAEISLSDIQKIVMNAVIGKKGYIYIFDQGKRIIGGSLVSGEEDFKASPMADEVLDGKSFIGAFLHERYKNSYGVNVVASGAPIESLGWGIIAEWPVDEADALLNTLKYQVFSFSLMVLIAVIVLSVILANKIVGPIKKLEEGTETIAKGKFDEPVEIDTNDEIEDLGIAFNKMTEGLKQLQALKDEFVFIAAHELKTPVAAIKGYLSIINDGLAGPVSDKVKDFIVKVLNANGRLIRLVEDLLEVARADAGKITIAVAPTDISAVVNETISELKPLADEKAIKVTYKPIENMPKASADSGRVREVMVNLMGNAIKYMGGRSTEKSIEIYHEIKDGALITHIKDNGLGMSKEALAKLFTKFYRVQTKETSTISGTGLGLFIVKQIIEKMNGKIWVESEEGKGSVFSFSLPISK